MSTLDSSLINDHHGRLIIFGNSLFRCYEVNVLCCKKVGQIAAAVYFLCCLFRLFSELLQLRLVSYTSRESRGSLCTCFVWQYVQWASSCWLPISYWILRGSSTKFGAVSHGCRLLALPCFTQASLAGLAKSQFTSLEKYCLRMPEAWEVDLCL